jgi:uncharacterized protein (DUF362 family)
VKRARLAVAAGAAAAAFLSLAACGKSSSPPAAPPADAVVSDAPPPVDAMVARVPVDAPPPPEPPPVDVTTGASPQWKPGPPVVVGDTVDGAALRAANRRRMAEDRSPVTILKGGTPLELGKRLCEQVVPRRPAAMPILLKPNMSGIDWFKNPRTNNGDDGVAGRITDPEFVRGVIQCLKARGHTRITVADGYGGKPADWQRLIKVSGYQTMCADEGVTLVGIADDGIFDVEGEQPGKPLGLSGMEKTRVPTLLIPRIVAEHLDHGLFLSLPKIKSHRFAVFSIGIKSLQGIAMYSDAMPASGQKWRTHREVGPALDLVKKNKPGARAAYVRALEMFARRMVDILEVDAPHAILAEGAPAMSGDGFQVLFPSTETMAIGGTNPVLVDRVGAELLGVWNHAGLAAELGGHETSPVLEEAAARFGVDLAKPAVTGDGVDLLAATRPTRFYAMAGFIIDDVAAAERRRVHAMQVADADVPVMDGVVDAVWERAAPLSFATDWMGRATPHAATVRVLWSSRGLHFLWQLEGAGLSTDTTRPVEEERANLYEEDCVEMFVAPDPALRARYAEIEVGPYGHWFDILVDRTGRPGVNKSDTAWSGALAIGTARDAAAKTATIEVTIAAPEIVAALRPGVTLPLGLHRMEGKKPRRYLMAFPGRTPKPSFHAPTGFGELVLDAY